MSAPVMRLDFKCAASMERSAGAWLLIGGILAGGATAQSFATADRTLGEIRQQDAALRQQYAPLPQAASTLDLPQLAAEFRHANDITRQLNLPWEGLFQALESAASKDVALLAILPDTRRQALQLQGEARSLDAVLAYLARLREQKILSQVTLSSHEIRVQEPDKPVRFSLAAQWIKKP